jgi:hypothetical protein
MAKVILQAALQAAALPESLVYMIGDRGNSLRRIRMAKVDYRRDTGELRRI